MTSSERADRIFGSILIAGWRLGLGWLIGRRFLLLTTLGRSTGLPHKVILRFAFDRGTFHVRSHRRSDWLRNLEVRPVATLQAWPGPLSVKAHRINDPAEITKVRLLIGHTTPSGRTGGASDEVPRIVTLEPTGQRTPDMVPPDLVWVWPVALAGWWAARRLLR